MANQRLSASAWREHILRWRDSGLPVQTYAEQSNVPAARLTYWARRLEREAQVVRLVPVKVHGGPVSTELQLRSPSGWTMCIGSQVEPAWLAALLMGLR